MEYETQLEELQREMEEVDEMEVDHNEGGGGEGGSGGGDAGGEDSGEPPLFIVTGPNGRPRPLNVDEDSDDEEVFTLAQGMKELGLNRDGKIVAWRQQDRS
jgi:hypothetical protein